MGLYERNIENLKLHKKYLWKALEQGKVEKSGISVNSREAKDGNLVLYIEKNGKEYRLNSAYRPLEEAKKWAEQYKFPHTNTICLLFGLGNGYLLRELIEKGTDTGFIVYEPNQEVLSHLLKQYDMSDFIANNNLIITVNENALKEILYKWITADNVELNQICDHPQYEKLFPEQKVIFLRNIRNASNLAITNKNTERKLGKRTVRNVLDSLARISKNYFVSDLKTLAETGAPAYIVSAGPSLDKNIHQLKNAKGHGVIIAVDKAISALVSAGIAPDFLIVEDAAKKPVYFASEEVRKFPLIASMSANAAITSQQKGNIYYYSSFKYTNKFLAELGYSDTAIHVGGSVATAAFSVCINAGFKTIVFVGQDLAYGEGGVTHTGGIVSGEKSQGITRYQVEGIDGTMVQTRNDWYIYLEWFGNWIEEYPDVVFLDATEGGAKIKGTQVITLKETVERFSGVSINCQEIMEREGKSFTKEKVEELNSMLESQKKDLKWLEKSMEKSEKAMNKLIRACENRSILKTSYNDVFKEVSKINKKAETLIVGMLLESYVAKELQHATGGLNYRTEDELKDKARVYKQSKNVYQVMKQGAKELREEMEKIVLE